MSVPKLQEEYSTKYLFHFTHINNLDSIVKNGLLSTNKKNEMKIDHLNVASTGIQERRSTMEVTCGPKGVVHDYVPFYLCSANPMLLSLINSKNIDQQLIIFLAMSMSKVVGQNVVFTDASANTNIPPNFYSDLADLDKLDWKSIESKKWKCENDDERHRRMAEILFHEKVGIEQIDYIIVWNEGVKALVIKAFENQGLTPPNITYSPFKSKYGLYFTKFMFGRSGETLVTGPAILKMNYEKIISDVLKKREDASTEEKYLFEDVKDTLEKVETNFCAIKELEGIFELESTNEVHKENVSDHTLKVVKNLEASDYYKSLSTNDQNILKLAAYLHDIGKGPKSRWKDGKQPVYPDHPVEGLKMLERFLVEDIKNLTEYQIKKICLLVAYHDLIGEIFSKGRDKQQLFNIVNNEVDFEMLAALNYADVSSIDTMWAWSFKFEIENLRKEILQKISEK